VILEGTPSALALSSAAPAKVSSKQSFQFLYVNVDRRAGNPPLLAVELRFEEPGKNHFGRCRQGVVLRVA
jgi:hypothetical protein